jgi:hypothetical protein
LIERVAIGEDDIGNGGAVAVDGSWLDLDDRAVEEVAPASEFLPSGHSCRRWGIATRDAKGQVTLDPDPWPSEV